ncbi:MAG TPA: transposase [Steroidobacteraceae bacterium]|nr:transposase [Steroidobacteraceae bacterium]
MPRTLRAIFPGVPHHVTQRGNHRERVFHAAGDSEAYLDLLRAYGRRLNLAIYAYCLMPNHVHLVVIPSTQESMHRTLQAVHSQFAQRINRMRAIGGHLWQGRYHSSALDSDHFLNAVRYVERNPVEAKLVLRAEDYRWSSAAAHCGMRNDPLLEPTGKSSVLRGIADWSSWLSQRVPDEREMLLRRNVRLGLPCGSDSFVEELGRTIGRDLRYHPRGGQRRVKGSDPSTNMKGSDPFV